MVLLFNKHLEDQHRYFELDMFVMAVLQMLAIMSKEYLQNLSCLESVGRDLNLVTVKGRLMCMQHSSF